MVQPDAEEVAQGCDNYRNGRVYNMAGQSHGRYLSKFTEGSGRPAEYRAVTSMPIIIDGWNLIRNKKSSIDDLSDDSLESARTLIEYLRSFQKTHRDPITLVFDSANEYLGMEYVNNAKLRIVPAKDADAYIKRFIDAMPEKQRANLRVVSSDNDIYYYAKSSYAVPVKSEQFWDKLNNA